MRQQLTTKEEQLKGQSRKLASEEARSNQLAELNAKNEARCTELQNTLDKEQIARRQMEERNRMMETDLISVKTHVSHFASFFQKWPFHWGCYNSFQTIDATI